MSNPQVYGRHTAFIEGNLAIVHFVGSVSLDEGRQLLSMFEQIIALHGHGYLIANIDRATTIDRVFRRELVIWMKTHALLGIANIKGSVLARSIGILLSNAMRLMGITHYASGFFESEAEARRWLAELEHKRQSAPSAPL
jgi:hypothetical protein